MCFKLSRPHLYQAMLDAHQPPLTISVDVYSLAVRYDQLTAIE